MNLIRYILNLKNKKLLFLSRADVVADLAKMKKHFAKWRHMDTPQGHHVCACVGVCVCVHTSVFAREERDKLPYSG